MLKTDYVGALVNGTSKSAANFFAAPVLSQAVNNGEKRSRRALASLALPYAVIACGASSSVESAPEKTVCFAHAIYLRGNIFRM